MKHLVIVLSFIAFLTSCRDSDIEVYRMPDMEYMKPAIEPNQIVRIHKFSNSNDDLQISRFSIVAIRGEGLPPGIHFLRVLGLPNERVSFDRTGVLINDEMLELPEDIIYLQEEFHEFYLENREFSHVISQDGYFLIGDNFEKALDSRLLGSISMHNIYGLVRPK